MKSNQNSKEIIYKNPNLKSYFNNAINLNPKRNSDDVSAKSKILYILKKNNSNAETAVDSKNLKTPSKNEFQMSSINIPKPKKKICIKYKDLVIGSEKSNDSSDNHIELALIIKKKKRFTNNSNIKNTNCNHIFLDNYKDKKDNNITKNPKISKSENKIILGAQNKENIFVKKIRKKLFCC